MNSLFFLQRSRGVSYGVPREIQPATRGSLTAFVGNRARDLAEIRENSRGHSREQQREIAQGARGNSRELAGARARQKRYVGYFGLAGSHGKNKTRGNLGLAGTGTNSRQQQRQVLFFIYGGISWDLRRDVRRKFARELRRGTRRHYTGSRGTHGIARKLAGAHWT